MDVTAKTGMSEIFAEVNLYLGLDGRRIEASNEMFSSKLITVLHEGGKLDVIG